MYKPIYIIALNSAIVVGIATITLGEETHLDVRVISKGAKFIGTSLGGAEVTITDLATGTLLARGKTAGSTGDTMKIMKERRGRHAPVSTEDAAIVKRDGKMAASLPLRYAGSASQFTARLDVDEPGAYEITVYAFDPANGNTGVDKTSIIVKRE